MIHTETNGTAGLPARGRGPFSNARRWLTAVRWAVLAGAVLLAAPAHADREIRRQVQCLRTTDDCPKFTVTLDGEGGVTAHDVWGSSSPRKGHWTLSDGVLEINVGGIFAFTGPFDVERPGGVKVDTKGRVVVRGTLQDLDLDGDRGQRPARAILLECDVLHLCSRQSFRPVVPARGD